MTVYAGTSGFAYPTWKPDFYPEKLPRTKFLQYYAGQLTALEVNYTFRRLPTASILDGWLADTPEGFQFIMKAHMRITHIDKLTGGSFLTSFLTALTPLKQAGRLGPILFQLPPTFACDVEILKNFLGQCPGGNRYVFEFRHASWRRPEVFDLMRQRGAALCLDEPTLKLDGAELGEFYYFRLRKPPYTTAQLTDFAGELTAPQRAAKSAFVFFKHEDDARGALWARELLDLTKPSQASGSASGIAS